MTALVLVSAPAAWATTWVRRGVVPCHVMEDHGWTLVVAGSGPARAAAPYDDPATVLLARPAGPRLAPSIGMGVVDDRAVVVSQASGWRTVQRWAVRPRYGPVVRTPELPTLRPDDLLGLAGPGADRGAVLEALADRQLTPHEWLARLLLACALPGSEVIEGTAALGPLVQPDESSRAAFAQVVKDAAP